MIKVKRALISVSDKKGLVPFAKRLHALGVEILSTGGTARQLKEQGIAVTEVSEYTGFPEMLDGRVKTLHPKIYAGLLALRHNTSHMEQVKKNNIGLIDMVVVNLYPFETVIKKRNVTMEEAIENIDIGGPAMLRAAAKNFKSVAVVSNPSRYQEILDELEKNNGMLSDAVLFGLAIEAFQHTAFYDGVISHYLRKKMAGDELSKLPKEIDFHFTKFQDLRYGENPHQAAALYTDSRAADGLAHLKQLHGKELSFNNILDLNAAIDFIKDFEDPAAVVIKHNNPSGLAENKNLIKAFRQAWDADPVSGFGGIVGLNRPVDEKTAKAIQKCGFLECVMAVGFDKKALDILSEKKNIRLVQINIQQMKSNSFDFKNVYGGLLLQQNDDRKLQPSDLKIVTKRKLLKKQMESLLFGWKVVKYVKSNAIVLVKGKTAVGIGCGQTSRVESVRLAIHKAGKNAENSVLVSDGFFPKTDNIQLAAKAGVTAIMQPGGSVADPDVIKACDKAKIVMVTTGIRHFKH